MSDRLLVATRKGLFTIERGARGWAVSRAAFVGDNLSMILPDARDGVWYAATAHGHFGTKLHCSRDAGESWHELVPPAYPARPEGAEPEVDSMGRKVPWSLEMIWSLEPGGPNQPGVLWCGTVPGGLFKSADGGKTWSMCRALWDDPRRKNWFGGGLDLPGIHSICVDPRNADRVVIGVSCGGVWVTSDGGQTWDCRANGMRAEYMPPERAGDPTIQDPHRVVQCPARPEVMWAQHHNGIFRTTDDGATWTELNDVKPSAFGFAAAVHPRDPDTAWFVPAIKDEKRVPVDGRVVVNRTRDGGRTFETLGRGLPGPFAYDIVFRHALAVDETGDRLAFGSSTGGLWVSENQGDSWDCVSAHLPPVYCVRFVR